jgi:hypothetical protein
MCGRCADVRSQLFRDRIGFNRRNVRRPCSVCARLAGAKTAHLGMCGGLAPRYVYRGQGPLTRAREARARCGPSLGALPSHQCPDKPCQALAAGCAICLRLALRERAFLGFRRSWHPAICAGAPVRPASGTKGIPPGDFDRGVPTRVGAADPSLARWRGGPPRRPRAKIFCNGIPGHGVNGG